MDNKPGIIITFEGVDFSGKSTQIILLRDYLEQYNLPVHTFSFPDRSLSTGRIIARYLKGKYFMPVEALFALFSVNRLERKSDIESIYNQGNVVLIDRYSNSGYAYGYPFNISENWLFALESQLPKADLIFLLDISPEVARERVKNTKEYDDFERNIRLQKLVREKYLQLSKEGNNRSEKWCVIDGSKSIIEVRNTIRDEFRKYMRTSHLTLIQLNS
jgi:dTMP kinase